MSLPIELGGHSLTLLPQRAVYRSANRTLYVADTHWGKAATFRARHIPLPEGSLSADLERLSDALAVTGAERLVILGDVIHSEYSDNPAVHQAVQTWRGRYAELQVEAVCGNHDAPLDSLAEGWGLAVLPPHTTDGGLLLRHTPPESPSGPTLCGHLHPTWPLRGAGRQSIRVPCFLQLPDVLILPAFAQFTGSSSYDFPTLEHVYICTRESVLCVY